MGFLQRLARTGPMTTHAAVLRNLTSLLNAKKGYAEATELFGLGDYDQHPATVALLETLIREIAENIRAYEPRAARPEVSFLGRESSLYATFRLRCEIDGRPAAFRIRMHTVLRYVLVTPMEPGLPESGQSP